MAFRHYTIGGVPVIQSSFLARTKNSLEPELDIKGMVEPIEYLQIHFPDDRQWVVFDTHTIQVGKRQDGYDYHENHDLRIRRASVLEKEIDGLTKAEVYFHYGCVCALIVASWPPIVGVHGMEELDNGSSLITRFYNANITAISRKFEFPMAEMLKSAKSGQSQYSKK